jgi:hypothetical protein
VPQQQAISAAREQQPTAVSALKTQHTALMQVLELHRVKRHGHHKQKHQQSTWYDQQLCLINQQGSCKRKQCS